MDSYAVQNSHFQGADQAALIIEIRSYEPRDKAPVVQIWTDCGLVVPWNDPLRDIRRKLAVQPELFLVGGSADHIIATAMAGYDGHRGWINYLAVSPAHQGEGIGKLMMVAAEIRLRAQGCPKINLQVRSSDAGMLTFYKKIGYKMDEVVSLGKRLDPDG